MTSDRIEQIQKECAYPDSVSVMNALMQVWNEVAQEYEKELKVLLEDKQNLHIIKDK